MERTPTFKRLSLEYLEKINSEQYISGMTKEKALEVIRMLLNANKEHFLGLKMPYEKLKNKIAEWVNCEEIKIKDMTKVQTIEFLANNFY